MAWSGLNEFELILVIMKTTVSNYKKDKYYPRVVKAVGELLSQTNIIAPVEVLIQMGNLSNKSYESWRKGQVSSLERVFEGSLSKANRILRIIKFHAHDLNMKTSSTVYKKFGKGPKHILRFSKSGDPNIEASYSNHYIWNQSQEKKPKLNIKSKTD